MPTPSFRLHTLGRLALVAPDGVADPSLGTRRRKLALLALLALSPRALSRDALVELFWGDQPEERARHSLSDALSHLRRTLGPGSITTRSAEVELAADAPLAVDARELAAAAAAGRWGEVVALYDGPFLDAVHVGGSSRWEQWVDGQRAQLEAHFITACRSECERLDATGEHDRRAEIAERWLAADPLSSPAAVHRLAALAAHGTREGDRRALAAYEALSRQLRAEFDDEPHDAVAALAREIAAREQAAPVAVALPTPAPAPAPAPRPAMESASSAAARAHRRWRPGRRALTGVAVAALALATLVWRGTAGRAATPDTQADSAGASATRRLATLGEATTLSPEALERYNAAMTRAAAGGGREATITLLRQALAFDSTFALAGYRLALIYSTDEYARDRVAAELGRAHRHAHRLEPRARLRTVGAYHMLVTGEYAGAARAYRELLTLEPDDASIWHELGMVYQYLGDERRAADAYERALAGNRRSIASWGNLLDARYASGDLAGARRALDELATTLPGHPELFRQTASVAAAEGDLALAEQQLRAMLAATPASPRTQAVGHMLLAGTLWAGGRVDEGDAEQRRAIALDRERGEPGSALLNAIALARATVWLRDDPAAARRILAAALRESPLAALAPLARPYLELATAWALAGAPDSARTLVAAYERDIPPHARLRDAGAHHLALGTIALQEGHLAEAAAELARVPGPLCTVCGLPELGLAYDRLGRPDSARAAYERYVGTPTLRRVELTDPFHRRWVAARLQALGGRGAPTRGEGLAADAR